MNLKNMSWQDYDIYVKGINPAYKKFRKKEGFYEFLYRTCFGLACILLVSFSITSIFVHEEYYKAPLILWVPFITLSVIFGVKYYRYKNKAKRELYKLSWEQIEEILGCEHNGIKSLVK